MSTLWFRFTWAFIPAIFLATPAAHAQLAVVDVGSIMQMIQQLITMEQQLTTAKDQLTQAKNEFSAMTGGRGMEQLLSGTVRNYLPTKWSELESVLKGASSSYGALTASLQASVSANAVLSAVELAALSPAERAEIDAARRSAALLDATAREALERTSERFTSLQQLIDAIPRASDQKAILDLQARIGVEQGMLQNERTKLDMINALMDAQRQVRDQQLDEHAIADLGSLRTLPPMGL